MSSGPHQLLIPITGEEEMVCNPDSNTVINSCTGEIIDETPVEIPPHNNLSGLQGGTTSERYHLTRAQWELIEQGGGDATTLIPTWSNTRTYIINEPVIQYDTAGTKMLYRSTINNNTNINPNTPVAVNWTLYDSTFTTDPLNWASTTTYNIGDYALTSAGPGIDVLLKSLINANLNNDPLGGGSGSIWEIVGIYYGLFNPATSYSLFSGLYGAYVRFNGECWFTVGTNIVGGLPLPTGAWEAIVDFTTIREYVDSKIPLNGSGIRKVGQTFHLGLDTNDLTHVNGRVTGPLVYLLANNGEGVNDPKTVWSMTDQSMEGVLDNATKRVTVSQAYDIVAMSYNNKTDVVAGLWGFGVSEFFNLVETNIGANAYNIRFRYDRATPANSIMEVRDDFATKGLTYRNNYAVKGILDDRWIPDYGAVKALVAGGGAGNLQAVLTAGNKADRAIHLEQLDLSVGPPNENLVANRGLWMYGWQFDGGTSAEIKLIQPYGAGTGTPGVDMGRTIGMTMNYTDGSDPYANIFFGIGGGEVVFTDPDLTSTSGIVASFNGGRVRGEAAIAADEFPIYSQVIRNQNTVDQVANFRMNGVGSFSSGATNYTNIDPDGAEFRTGTNITSISPANVQVAQGAIYTVLTKDEFYFWNGTRKASIKADYSSTPVVDILLTLPVVSGKLALVSQIPSLSVVDLQYATNNGNTTTQNLIVSNSGVNNSAVFAIATGTGTAQVEANNNSGRFARLSSNSLNTKLELQSNSAINPSIQGNSATGTGIDIRTGTGTGTITNTIFNDGRMSGSTAQLSNQFTVLSQVIENQVGPAQTANFRISGTGFFGVDPDFGNQVDETGMVTVGAPYEALRYSNATQFKDTTGTGTIGTYSSTLITFVSGTPTPLKTINIRPDFALTPNGVYTVTLPISSGKLALESQIPTSFSLQTVTNGSGNNRTSNVLGVTGTGNMNAAIDGLYMLHIPGGTQSSLIKATSGSVKNSLDFTPTKTELLYIGTTTGHFTLRDENSGQSGAKLDTRLEVLDAINSTEAITLSQLTSGLSGKQATLVSGTTIKTINGTSLLGSGDIAITVDTSTLVPYTGATTNVNLGSNTITSTGGFIGNASTATTAGTVTIAAQPAITSIGTLSALTVTAPIVGTVTNGVVTTGSYADPAWITSLAYAKLTGAPSLAGYELLSNKQNSLTVDGSGNKYPTVDAINTIGNGLIHTTGVETKVGTLTLNSPAAAAGATALTPFMVLGANGGDKAGDTGTQTAGRAGDIVIQTGNGGTVSGLTTGTASNGRGGHITIRGGDAGLHLAGSAGFKGYGAGGNIVIQAGGSYGTQVAAPTEMKAGNNYTAGGNRGGSIYFVAGYGNNNFADDPAYNGTVFIASSFNQQVRGNAVVGSVTDDYVNRFQVTGDSKFTGKAYVTVAPTDPTGVVRKTDLDTAVADKISNATDTYGGKITNVISLSQAEYDAIVTKDANTLYVIV